jgi:Tfp pilus assembly protein PilF
MELAVLVAVERAAEQAVALGIAYLAAEEHEAARRELSRALRLHRTPLAERLLAFSIRLESPAAAATPAAEHCADRTNEAGPTSREALSPQASDAARGAWPFRP